MATKSVDSNPYGGLAELSRSRAFLLAGAMSVLGLIMGVTWTVVRDDLASSDGDPAHGTPFVADSPDDTLPAAGVRTSSPGRAALPAVTGTRATALNAPGEPIALVPDTSAARLAAPALGKTWIEIPARSRDLTRSGIGRALPEQDRIGQETRGSTGTPAVLGVPASAA